MAVTQLKNVLVTKKFYRLFCRIKKAGVALDNMVLKPNLLFPAQNVKNRRAPKSCGIDCEMFERNCASRSAWDRFFVWWTEREFACETLNEINKLSAGCPWQLSFLMAERCRRRFLKQGRKSENVRVGQEAFLRQAN